MTTTCPPDVAEIVGPVGAKEYEDAEDYYKDDLAAYARGLADRSDADFLGESVAAICEAAMTNSWRGNWKHVDFKATACYYEAKRRHQAAGHAKDCRGETIYSRAHARAMRQNGHIPMPPTDCTCGAGER